MVLALVVPVLMLVLLIAMDVFEERLFAAKPASPPPLPNPETLEGRPPVDPPPPPRRRPG